MIVEHVHPDGRTLFDGDAQGEVGNPNKDVTGKLFSPYGGTGALNELRDDVTVNNLPCDEQGNGQQAGERNIFSSFRRASAVRPAWKRWSFPCEIPVV